MGWSTPYDGTAGEVITEAIWDTYLKDNLRYLKGLDGVPTIQSGLIIASLLGTEYLLIPSLTTTERNALTPVNGMLIYNETTFEFNKYEAGGWKDLGGGVDHGGLDGLTDDDHTQYQKESLLTTAGDIPYATAPSTWARLGIGTALQSLRVNAGATAPEWVTGAFAASTSGSYIGDSTVNRAIAHGLGVTPKLVFIQDITGGGEWFRILGTQAGIYYNAVGAMGVLTVTISDNTSFYVGNDTSYQNSANVNASLFTWVGLG